MMHNQLSPQHKLSLQSILTEKVQWTQLDFLHHLKHFSEAERKDIVASWIKPMDSEDDFRFIDLDNRSFIFAEKLKWDSDFFGYNIVRINSIIGSEHLDMAEVIRQWLDQAKKRNVRYVLFTIFPEDLDTVQTLGKCGFELVETRFIYHSPLEQVLLPEQFPIRLATSDDIPVLSRIAREMVNPFDRFHADPFISPLDKNRMMSEWVRVSIEDDFADFVVVPDVPTPLAFCTVKTHRDKWNSWGVNLSQSVVLGAVDPAFKGWYRKLISESNRILNEQDASHVFWKTQSTNRAAIRTAEKLGYQYGRSEHVFRIIL